MANFKEMSIFAETERNVTNSNNEVAMEIRTILEGQVTIHILHQACFSFCTDCNIEVHKGFHLIPDSCSKKSELIHIENRSSSLKFNIDGEFTRFTLLFSALPKSCKTFDLVEPGVRGWRLFNIKRNKTDVYNIKIHKGTLSILTNG